MVSTSKLISIGFLVLILIISLAISLLYPCVQIENFQEGLLSGTEQTNIKTRMQKYVVDTETICKTSISGGNGEQGINKLTWANQTEENNVLPIIQNTNYTNTAKIDNLNKITPPLQTPEAIKILQNNVASRYALTVTLLNDLKNMNITDDTKFTELLTSNLATPIPTGNNSSYTQISNYLDKITS